MQYGSRKRLSAKGSGLYLVLEDIEEGNGDESGLIAQKFATRNEIKDFTNTANSFRAVGVEARHASILIGTPIAKMTLKEAQALIRQLPEAWLKKLISSH